MSEPVPQYIARTALGVPIRSFESRDMALTWAEIEGHRFPGWQIIREVEVISVRRIVLRRDRSHLTSTEQEAAA